MSNKVDHDTISLILNSVPTWGTTCSGVTKLMLWHLVSFCSFSIRSAISSACTHTRPIVFTSVADPDPHHFGKLDPDPHQSGKLDPDLDPQQSEKVQASEGLFEALEGPNLGKVSGRIRIELNGRIRFRIRVKGKIRIRIEV